MLLHPRPRLAFVAAASWLLLLLMLRVDAQAVCANTGLVSPDVVTMVVSPTATAWLIGPDCDLEEAYPRRGSLSIVNKGIERVVSTPSGLGFLGLTGNPLTRGADFSSLAGSLALTTFSPKLLSNINFPSFPAFSTLALADSAFTSLKGVVIPDILYSLTIEQTQLKSLKGVTLPSGLHTLVIRTSKLTSIDLSFPAVLNELEITTCLITKLERVVFPDSLLKLEMASNAISSVKGVTWPQTLQYLGLAGNPIVEFEIRESDIPIFEGLTTLQADFSNVQCTDPTAEMKKIQSSNVCVISDTRFETLYRTLPASPTPSTTKTPKATKKPSNSTRSPTSTADESASSDESSPQDEESSSSSTTDTNSDSKTSGDTSTGTTGSSDGDVASTNNAGPSAATRAPTLSDLAGSGSQSVTIKTVIQTKPSSSSTMIAVLVVLSAAIAVLVGICIFRACVASKKKKTKKDLGSNSPIDDRYTSVDTPGASTQLEPSSIVATAPAEEYLANDVRNDKAMIPFRIALKDIKLNKRIARGGYGVIYRAVYEGRNVAVKQMLPGSWHDDRALASFMDEIRLCASLSHPKIVTFVGIAYSSLRDLSVVIEFMPGGDLHVLLESEQEKPRSAKEWCLPWTSSQVKCKASIGQDVADAVGYLHSLDPPILHRDLKARNVLIDREGNAKLSDFGISRKLLIDQTMTSEIGTAAWIAPEVLRGARYSEKADIYSLGVLLVELDRCQHPYAGEPVLQRGAGHRGGGDRAIKPNTMSHVAQKNTQIAVLVSTGKLRPSVSSECPSQIAALVTQCLSFDSAERPSAIEVANVLMTFVQDPALLATN